MRVQQPQEDPQQAVQSSQLRLLERLVDDPIAGLFQVGGNLAQL